MSYKLFVGTSPNLQLCSWEQR